MDQTVTMYLLRFMVAALCDGREVDFARLGDGWTIEVGPREDRPVDELWTETLEKLTMLAPFRAPTGELTFPFA
jgi:hypothetical protein